MANASDNISELMGRFAKDAFAAIQKTDLEANTVFEHFEAGLCSAARHWRMQIEAGACAGPAKWRTMKEEDTWTWRLREHLADKGYQLPPKDKAEERRKYGSKRIDSVVLLDPNTKLWL